MYFTFSVFIPALLLRIKDYWRTIAIVKAKIAQQTAK